MLVMFIENANNTHYNFNPSSHFIYQNTNQLVSAFVSAITLLAAFSNCMADMRLFMKKSFKSY
jgi:hypothetical protein